MKTVKELLAEAKRAPSYSTSAVKQPAKAPPIILFRRTAIRTFPDGRIVALYYSPQLDKYVSIPFAQEGNALTIELSEEQVNEWVQPAIQGAVRIGGALARSPAGQAAIGTASRTAQRAGGALSRYGRRFWRRLKRSVGMDVDLNGNDDPTSKNPRFAGKEHVFNDNLGRSVVSNPTNIWNSNGNSPITNYRQRQNQNFIWKESIETLERIVENKQPEIFGNTGVNVTPIIAKKLLNLYESLNKDNKKNFQKTIGESADSLRKIINFSLKV